MANDGTWLKDGTRGYFYTWKHQHKKPSDCCTGFFTPMWYNMCVCVCASERLCVGVFSFQKFWWKASSFSVIPSQRSSEWDCAKFCLKLTCRCNLTVSLPNIFKLARKALLCAKTGCQGSHALCLGSLWASANLCYCVICINKSWLDGPGGKMHRRVYCRCSAAKDV